jgi:uncharacterized membrane-anchored protein YjiN (DUF445 family)
MAVSAVAPPLREEELRAEQLRVMKRRATGLLVVMAAAFVAVNLTGDGHGLSGYLRAAAEGSLVGGLADWFAVTALFRHPLGLPIPHTAVIRERKDQFGATLGNFVQENFLSPAIVAERVRASRAAARAAAWLSQPANAETLGRHAGEVLVGIADVVRDDDVQRVLHEELERAIERIEIAPLAGRALRAATADGRHQELLDALLNAAGSFLDENRTELRERFGRESPWWLPGAVEDRIFDRMLDGVRRLIESVCNDPNHEMRALFDERVAVLADRLEHDPALRARGEQLKRDVLAHPELRRWSASLWTDLKASLREQAGDPESRLRRGLASAVVAAGERLGRDEALQRKAEELVESGVRYIAEHYRDEIAGLVSGTIARWDGEETSRKLELLLGRDLQFIRINGTVVGGLAGVAIHGIAGGLGA